jgi:hypothetical protein
VVGHSVQGIFRWTVADGLISLGRGLSRDMTPDGKVFVGTNLQGGFRWTPELGFERLGEFKPVAISDDGRTMIGDGPEIWMEGTGAVELQPFLTSLGLDLAGWTLTEARAISGDGTTIAGRGIPPDPMMSGAWIAVIPEPPTARLVVFSLAAAAMTSLVRRLRRGP